MGEGLGALRAKLKSATVLAAISVIHRARFRGCVVHSIADRFLNERTTYDACTFRKKYPCSFYNVSASVKIRFIISVVITKHESSSFVS